MQSGSAMARTSRPGVLSHKQLLRELTARDVFVFCHKTPESPRCLIEALQCGLPIVGYESAYPSDLIRRNAGGLLTRPNDPIDLAQTLKRLASNHPASLVSLWERALRDGVTFSAENVFQHRAQLMRSLPSWTVGT
jgi:glycosyltransferase involved in cell wall biosynthesis